MDTVLGQPRAIDLLYSTLASGRLHHAYIFHGPRGVGKFTTAWAFARVLLCHAAEPDLAGRVRHCGTCASCRLLLGAPEESLSQPHPDLHVVTKELARFSEDRLTRERKLMNIPVEVLRQALIEPIYLAPGLGSRKVFIVDEAELMVPYGQNALLKALEEPPAGTFIILATANEDRLLPTVRSRCQRIAFVPLEDATVEAWLVNHVGELEAGQRKWLVDFAGGSLGQARLAASYDLYAWARQVLPVINRMTEGDYPTDLGAGMAKCIDSFAENWVKERANASKEAANKLAAGLMWRMISQHARRKMADAAARCDNADPIATEERLSPWVKVIDALVGAEEMLNSNVNMGLVCDHLTSVMYRSLAGVAAK